MSRTTTRRTARRLLGVAALAALSILTVTSARAANASAASIAASHIKADSAQFPVFGVTLNQTAEVDSLTNVTVRFNAMVNFTTGDLAPDFSAPGCTNGDATSCDGVQMFRDDGSTDDALDASDTPISTGFSFVTTNCALGCTADLALSDEVAGIPIPLSSANEGYTFLIAIRSSSSIGNTDQFTVSLTTDSFTTIPTPTLLPVVVTTDPITADTVAPAAPSVTGLGLSKAAGRVHVTTPAVSAENPGTLEVYASGSDTCSGPSLIASSGAVDLNRTRDDLLGASAESALKAFPPAQFVCYRVVDPAGNASPFVSDGQLPGAPSAANVVLLSASNVTGAKVIDAAPDTAARTMRLYIRPGDTGNYVRARNEDAVNHDEWIEVTTSTTASVCSVNPPSTTCTTDIRRYESSTSAGPTLAAGDGVGYSLVNANGNEGDVTADGVVPAAPVSGDSDLLRVSAAGGKQRLAITGGVSGAVYGMYMDVTGLGTTFRRAVSSSGALVTVTATGGNADSGTSEIRSETPSGTQLASGHAIGYVAIGSGGNISALTAEGTIPAAPAASDLTFSDALDQFRWNPAVLPANTNVRAFAGPDAASAYGNGTGLGTATSTSAVPVADQPAGANVFYTAINTVSGHESPTTADGSIPAAPSGEDAGLLSTSAANGHQRTISGPDVNAPRTFRLYLDTAGGSAWTRAATTSGGSTPVEVTSAAGSATSGGTPGTQNVFAGTTQLAAAHATGFALVVGGNDSDVVADGSIPSAPDGADGAVADAANTFTFAAASPAYRVNLHLGGPADTASLAYSQSGPDATTNSSSPVSIADPANDATVFYTATEPVSGNESRTTADGAIPAPPSAADANILSVSAVEGHQRLRADTDASGPRTFRLFADPAGGSGWLQAATTSGGASPIEVTTATSGSTASSSTSIFAGAQQIAAGWSVGYGSSNANGHASDVVADGSIPAAPDLSTAAATAATDQVVMTGIAAGRTVRVFTDPNADRSSAYSAGAKATLTATDGDEPLDTDGGHGVWYTSTANVSGNESPIVTDGPIPNAIAANTTEASDVFNRFTVPGASVADNVLIILSASASPFDAYADAGAQRWTATQSPFWPGGELNAWFVYYTVKSTVSGNESPITSAGSIPAAPADAPNTMSSSAALQRISSTLDSAVRTLRLYVDTDASGANPFERASTTSNGSTPVQIVTSTSAEVVGGQGIFVGAAPLNAGHDVAYARVLGQNESDLVADGSIPFAPLTDTFTASAADQQATIAASAITGTYRVFRGSAPASDKRTHTSGTATVVPTSGLVAGDALGYALSNAAGNESPAFADGSIPSIGAPVLQSTSDSGVSDSDRITNVTTPVFDFTTVAGASVTLLEGGATRGGPVVADGFGAVSITSSALAEGTRSLTALAVKDGNTSPLSSAISVTIDVTPPAAPAAAPDLDAGSDTGDSATDDLTSVATPAINVTGAPNGSVSLKEDATVLGTAATDGSGVGQATTSALSDGPHTIVATTFDTAGNESPASSALTITVDTVAPSVPSVPDLQASSDSNVVDDNVTNVASPVLDVAGADANVTVVLRDFGADVTSVSSGSGGTVALTASSLSDGTHSFTAASLDAAGNASSGSGALVVTVDTVAPVVPGVPDLVAASDSGSSASDDLTNDATPSLSMAGNETGATVILVEGATPIGSAVADGNGDATATTGLLADGQHLIAAKATDLAGNGSAPSDSLTVTVDTVAPDALASAPDLVTADDSGSSDADDVTNVTTPSFFVSGAEAGAVVAVFADASQIGAGSADSAGEVTVASSALSDGTLAVTAFTTDAAGNTGTASPALSVTIDTVAPPVPAMPDLLAASDSGRSSTDNVTNDTTPEVRVEGTDSGVSVVLLDASTQVASGVTSLAGLVDLSVAPAVAEGVRSFTATATDAAGNESAASPALSVTIDTTAPAAASKPDLVAASDSGSSDTDDITNDATPDVLVAGEANAILELFNGAASLGQRTGDGTVTASALADGTHSITVKATDVAGNTGVASPALPVTVDTAAPTAVLTAPSSLLGNAKAVFSEPIGGLETDDVFVRLDPAFPAATRATAPKTSSLIYDAPTKTATLSLRDSLLPGEYYQLVVAAAPVDVAGNVVAETVAAFRGSVVEQEINSAGKHGWRIVGTSSHLALGGSYATERASGARISMVFSGTEVTWYTITGPGQGMAHVYIDGTYMGLFNNYAPGNTYRVQRRFSGLSSALHTILIIVDGRKGHTSASDTHVAVDAFAIRYPSGNRVTIASPPLTYLWRIITDPNADGGRYVLSDQPGAAVSFTFRGTKFAWYPVFGPANGLARVFIDGVDKGVVDLYSSGARYNWLRFFGGLSDGVHTVRIVALGQRNGASRGTLVTTDRYAVG